MEFKQINKNCKQRLAKNLAGSIERGFYFEDCLVGYYLGEGIETITINGKERNIHDGNYRGVFNLAVKLVEDVLGYSPKLGKTANIVCEALQTTINREYGDKKYWE
ncbi:hypothetical protein KAT80_03260 [Candidatus Pacearchaeota archaeon]|nr:hypothetical protein [Candidatus Pacearchaeota archaeon]